ncbi:hypothetical protein ACFZC5_12540 [Nocardia gamkensis]|jgi:hypothetical protein|uniref:hypothetical protein n=1 Tax=Nocardia gamkensis TaxID=352869 RepID=UPI0036EB9536
MADLDPRYSAPRRDGRARVQDTGTNAIDSRRAAFEDAAERVLRVSGELNRRLV